MITDDELEFIRREITRELPVELHSKVHCVVDWVVTILAERDDIERLRKLEAEFYRTTPEQARKDCEWLRSLGIEVDWTPIGGEVKHG